MMPLTRTAGLALCVSVAVTSAHAEEDASPDAPKASIAAVEAEIAETVDSAALAVYAGDADAALRAFHPEAARRTLVSTFWGEPSDQWVRELSPTMLGLVGTRYNRAQLDDPANGRRGVKVFDVESETASARVLMDTGYWLLHLGLVDGEWVIVDQLSQPLESGAEPPEPTADDEAEVRTVVMDYVMGFYELDGDKVQRTCHPSLSKRTIERLPETEFDWFRGITYEEIRLLGERFNRDFGFSPERNRKDIDVYYVDAGVAAAKLTASSWFDYFHLAKVNGRWQIVNIVFEPLAEDRAEPAL